MKDFKIFYEVGNNRYSTLKVDDELFIATSTFIKKKPRFKFLKEKEITQGLKLLKITPIIMVLFDKVIQLKPLENQQDEAEELVRYEEFDYSKVKEDIFKYYEIVYDSIKEATKKAYDEAYSNAKSKNALVVLTDTYNKKIEEIDAVNPLKSGKTSLTIDDNGIVQNMCESGFYHLYTDKINGFLSYSYIYNVDVFGKLTIYKIALVKNVVQNIDTFMYDTPIIRELLVYLEKGEK